MLRALLALPIALVIVPAVVVPAAAEQETARGPIGDVPRADSPIRVDGRVNEAAWRRALRLELPHETSPGENLPAVVATDVLLLQDASSLYVAFVAHDPRPEDIRAHLADRDDAFRDDLVGFVLDTFNDSRRGVALYANPLGVQLDAAIDETGDGGGFRNVSGARSESYQWDAIWDAAGRITPAGYEVEFGVPFHALRFDGAPGPRTWGFAAVRQRPRVLMRRFSSVPIDRGRSCFLCQIGRIRGFEDATPGLGLEIVPTLTRQSTSQRDVPGGPETFSDDETDAGLTARWSVTPDMTLGAAINPDFSQVEADTAQLVTNRRFALFFPEKRPFFLEALDVFDTPIFAVNTRSVADPDWGLKLTGKAGRHAVGVFAARDDATGFVFPGNESSSGTLLEQESLAAVARYRLDVGETSTLGLLGTLRDGADYSSGTVGVDGNLRLSPADTLRFQWLRSSTRYPEAVYFDSQGDPTGFDQPRGRFEGDGVSFVYAHDSRDWSWEIAHEAFDERFRADLGFVPRVDTRDSSAGLERVVWGAPGAFLNRTTVGAEITFAEDFDGVRTDELYGLSVRFDGPLQSFLRLSTQSGDQTFAGRTFDTDRASLFFNIRPSGVFTTSLQAAAGRTIGVLDVRALRERMIEPEMTLNLGRRFFTQLRHMYQELSEGGRIVSTENLAQGTFSFHFGLRSFLRAIVQHRRTARDLGAFACLSDPPDQACTLAARERSLFGQLLFSYKLNPRTVLFLGATESRRAGDSEPLGLTDRVLFFKVGYAFVL